MPILVALVPTVLVVTSLLSHVSLDAAPFQAPVPPPIPTGLWLSREEGFVVRIEPCSDGFCGFAAGTPRDPKRKKVDGTCGKTMMRDFKWNAKAKRWEGRMGPPQDREGRASAARLSPTLMR